MKKFLFLLAPIVLSTFILNAQTNYALRFYGHGVNDIDRVKIPLENTPVNIDSNFTIEFRFKGDIVNNPLGVSANQSNNDDWTLGHIVIDRDVFGQGDYGDYGISFPNGRIAFGVNNGISSFTIMSNQTFLDNQWHYVAAIRNATTGYMALYVDGILRAFEPNGPIGNISYRPGRPTAYINDPYLVIGAEKHDYDVTTYPSFNGFIDELRISNIIRYTSNYSLTQWQFQPDANTVALYHFDEGNGDTIYDSSNNPLGASHGLVSFGGSNPSGPVWVEVRDSSSYNDSTYLQVHDIDRSVDVLIYPTLANDFLCVNTSEVVDDVTIEIYDQLGILRHKNSYPSRFSLITIPINHYSSGIYFVKVYSSRIKEFTVKRILKL